MTLNLRNKLRFWNTRQINVKKGEASATDHNPKRFWTRSSLLIGTLALGFFLWSLFQFVNVDGVGAASTNGIKPQFVGFDLLTGVPEPAESEPGRSEVIAAPLGEPAPIQFGIAETDFPIPLDFDGDGKTDIAVRRSGTPNSYSIMRSSDGIVQNIEFGIPGDWSVPADYDGDGKADPASFRCGGIPSTCTYTYLPSSQGWTNPVTVHWGSGIFQTATPSIAPISGDFDGDGKEDFCVYTITIPSLPGTFRILRSSDSQTETITFGIFQSDWILTGDYDGDGRTDFILPRTGNGPNVPLQWNVLTRSGGGTGETPIVFGISSDFPVLGDYDGDGKTDLAFWRQSSTVGGQSTFHVRRSSDGTIVVFPLGTQGDYPVGRWRNV